jgi:hypothetical protein
VGRGTAEKGKEKKVNVGVDGVICDGRNEELTSDCL